MRRYGLIIAGLLFLCLPALAGAQGVLGPLAGSLNPGFLAVVPSVGVGWQRMGVAFSSDISFEDRAPGFLEIYPVDLRLTDANVWIGRAGLETRTGEGLLVFFGAEGNAGRNVEVETPLQPENGVGAETNPAIWVGSHLEWWRLEGGVGYPVGWGFTVIGALRVDHLQLSLEDPWPNSPLAGVYPEAYKADFQAKTWTPYAALRLNGSNYRGTVAYGPVSWCDFKLPFRLSQTAFPPPSSEEAQYSLRAGGYLLEGSLEYDMNVVGVAGLTLWGRASTMKFTGNGELKLSQNDPLVPPPVVANRNADSQYTRYDLALGMSGRLAF